MISFVPKRKSGFLHFMKTHAVKKRFRILWICLMLIFSGLPAQNQGDLRIFEQANSIRFAEPQEALKIYDYLLKNSKPEQAVSILLKKSETELLLHQYQNGVTDLLEAEKKISLNPDPGSHFELLLLKNKLFRKLDFQQQINFENITEIYARLPREIQDQYHIFYNLEKILSGKDEKKEKLEELARKTPASDPYHDWVFYLTGKLQPDPESARVYFENIDPQSELFLKSKVRIKSEKPADSLLKVVLQENRYFFEEQKLTVWSFYRHWLSEKNRDSISKYRNLLQALRSENHLEKQLAKTAYIQQVYFDNSEKKTAGTAGKKRIYFAVLILLILFAGYIFARRSLTNREEKSKSGGSKIIISDKAEEAILKRLEDFENSNLFLDKNLRLAGLARHLDTNTRYLSAVINAEKKRSFNSYINSLRINYIVARLRTDPAYLSYKISYLAEASGFASQSSFTAAFKEETGETPSVFIKNLAGKRI